MHGGKSTGPRTPDGKQRSRAARITHGFWTLEQRAFRGFCAELIASARLLTRSDERLTVSRRQDPMQSGGTCGTIGRHEGIGRRPGGDVSSARLPRPSPNATRLL
jgi:hypothetical protein